MKYIKYSIWVSVIIGIVCIVSIARSAEWNQKPVLCADFDETFRLIAEKGEMLLWSSVQFAKVKGPEKTYREEPELLTSALYVNPETRTYTVLEYHPKYLVYCVTSWGADLLYYNEIDPETYYQPNRDVFK